MSAEHGPQFSKRLEIPQDKDREFLGSRHLLQVSGVVIASDGIKNHSPLDIINTPFYGGWKLLLKDKILNPSLLLNNGTPLIEPAIKAMFDAKSVSDVVIVGNEDQREKLEEISSRNAKGKPYKVIPNNGHIGEVVVVGADNISSSGYFFAIMPDLPYANGQAVDFAVTEILREGSNVAVYLPIVSAEFFNIQAQGWSSTFTGFQEGEARKKLKVLNFFIADSRNVNSVAIKRYYDIRTIHSLKGKLNAVRHFPALLPEVALKYLTSRLSISTLEEMGSELYRGEIRVVEVTDPSYIAFLKDVDTLKDYKAYQRDTQNTKV